MLLLAICSIWKKIYNTTTCTLTICFLLYCSELSTVKPSIFSNFFSCLSTFSGTLGISVSSLIGSLSAVKVLICSTFSVSALFSLITSFKAAANLRCLRCFLRFSIFFKTFLNLSDSACALLFSSPVYLQNFYNCETEHIKSFNITFTLPIYNK